MKIDNNLIRRIPFAIRKMTKLKTLSLASNQLESLPSSLERLRLDSVDISKNLFAGHYNVQPFVPFHTRVPTLFEIAGRIVEKKR